MHARHLLILTAVLCTAAEPRVDRYGDPLPPGAVARLGTVRFRHGDELSALAYSPDGRMLAATSRDGRIICWDAVTGQERCRAEGDYRQLEYVDGARRLIAVGEHHVDIYDSLTGEILLTMKARDWAFIRFAVSPDRQSLAVGASFGSAGFSVGFFDVRSGRETRRLDSFPDFIENLAFSPGGRLLAVAVRTKAETLIILRDLATGKEVWRCTTFFCGSSACLAFSPDGKKLTAMIDGAKFFFCDVATGTELPQLTDPVVFPLAVTLDGQTMADRISTTEVRLWDHATNEEIRRIDGPENCYPLQFAPDGRTLAIGCGHMIRRFDVATGSALETLGGHPSEIRSAIWSPDGRNIVTSGADGTFRYWEAVTGREVFCSPERYFSNEISFAPNGNSVVVAASDGDDPIRQFDFPTGRERVRFGGKGAYLESLSFAPDGKTLVTDSNGTLKKWDAVTGKQLPSIWINTNWPLEEGRARMVRSPCYSSDGHLFAAIVYCPDIRLPNLAIRLRVWDNVSGQELPPFDGQESVGLHGLLTTKLAFTPDGRTIAAIEGGQAQIRLWEAGTGRTRRIIELDPGHAVGVTISSDGRHLAAAVNRTVYIWDITTGRDVRRFHGHGGTIEGLAFSPDGRRLLSWGHDTTALIWDVADLMNRK
jgi:WD40 repeat protein